jgi:hypothetical protein
MGPDERRDPTRAALDDLLTRAFYSAAGYVFESDPYTVPEDGPVLETIAGIRGDDRRHARVLGELIQARGGVPQPAVFPFWDQDLNYVSVPYLSGFVCDTIEDDVQALDSLIARWPKDDASGLAALEAIRNDKRAHLARLRPVADAARAREAATYADRIAARKKARAARLAKEKAEAEAAKKAKAAGARPAAAPGARPAAPLPAVAKAAPPPPVAAAVGDPNEPGISSKEKARRTMARMRAAAGTPAPSAPAPAAAAAPVPSAAPLGADLGDPDEPGISPKEKAKRKVARLRAASGGPAPGAAPPAAAPTPAAAPVAAAPLEDLGDPDEPGISPKEKAKRKVARMRAAGGGPAGAPPAPAAAAAPPEPAAPEPIAEDLGDPDEPGISPKEKARRKVAQMRAQQRKG